MFNNKIFWSWKEEVYVFVTTQVVGMENIMLFAMTYLPRVLDREPKTMIWDYNSGWLSEVMQ